VERRTFALSRDHLAGLERVAAKHGFARRVHVEGVETDLDIEFVAVIAADGQHCAGRSHIPACAVAMACGLAKQHGVPPTSNVTVLAPKWASAGEPDVRVYDDDGRDHVG